MKWLEVGDGTEFRILKKRDLANCTVGHMMAYDMGYHGIEWKKWKI